MRVTIVGAGIIGLSLAWELARRGASVRITERGLAGRETSWAAAGILPAARRETAADPLERLNQRHGRRRRRSARDSAPQVRFLRDSTGYRPNSSWHKQVAEDLDGNH